MTKRVTLIIDDQQVEVPAGTLVVDAAKMVNVDIPVFCYHPKMEPVGMCRMCLVEIGRPVRDRATGEFVRNEDGSLQIRFGPKLETACTVPVSEGMVVRTKTEAVRRARKDIVEFLLTSHPLDCPICDKGGECPLQNLTMEHGPGESRFLYDEKFHLEKRVPLGDLIILDRERCIQCKRCIRFQDEIVDDPVIHFYHRGRHTDIVTFSDPPFDSYWSGNTTDICPVGALTTADFRFGARPWEMRPAASLCTHCPVGCNTTLSVRREAKSGGRFVVKRTVPRQNEWVNEIWICDKGRFGYHFTESTDRLTRPLVRKDGELVEATWDEALERVAEAFRQTDDGLFTLVGGRLSNEDLFNIAALTDHLGGGKALYTQMAGGDLVSRVGLTPGSNLADLGSGDAILVVATDLEEEAPLWWLRVKQAAERGATLIVANPRPTKTERYASHVLRYAYGEEARTVLDLLDGEGEAAKALAEAANLVVFYGGEGLGLDGTRALTQACANLLIRTGHVGRPNNGLVAVWQRANDQGAWEMGYRPADDLAASLAGAQVAWIAAADPAGVDPALAQALDQAGFVVVQELFLTETARRADVVLPAQAFTEREGTLTNGERRVQRYYPAVPPLGESKADFAIAAELGARLGLELPRHASLVLVRASEALPVFQGVTYPELAKVEPQWPIIGREDLYYGGTSYENTQGLGVQLPSAGEAQEAGVTVPEMPEGEGLLAVPVTRLYDRGTTLTPSEVLHPRLPQPFVALHPATAQELGLKDGQNVAVRLAETDLSATLRLDETLPTGVLIVPRSLGLPITAPTRVQVHAYEMA